MLIRNPQDRVSSENLALIEILEQLEQADHGLWELYEAQSSEEFSQILLHSVFSQHLPESFPLDEGLFALLVLGQFQPLCLLVLCVFEFLLELLGQIRVLLDQREHDVVQHLTLRLLNVVLDSLDHVEDLLAFLEGEHAFLAEGVDHDGHVLDLEVLGAFFHWLEVGRLRTLSLLCLFLLAQLLFLTLGLLLLLGPLFRDLFLV